MSEIRGWMAGKKTYLLAAGILLVGLGLLLTGKLTPATASGLILFAACAFPVTYRAALERHQKDTLAALQQIALVGASVTVHNYPEARAEGAEAMAQIIRLGQTLATEANAGTVEAGAVSIEVPAK